MTKIATEGELTGTPLVDLFAPAPFGTLEAGFPGELSAEQRTQGLRSLREGNLSSIKFKANVFSNENPNRNHLRFYDKDMQKFAGSFASKPFLRDHDARSIESREGTIRASSLEDGWVVQEVEITTQKGMLAFLEGQIDRFSIGWFYKDVNCSVCGKSWLSQDCHHFPGRKYPAGGVDKKGGKAESVLCELYMVEPEGKEVSAVNAPAVPGTGLLAELMARKEDIVAAKASVEAVSEATGVLGVSQIEDVTEVADVVAPALDIAPAFVPAPVAAPVVDPWLAVGREVIIEAKLTNARLSPAAAGAVRAQLQFMGNNVTPAQLDALIGIQQQVERATALTPVRGMGPTVQVETPTDLAQTVVEYLLGVEDAKTPPGNYRSMKDLYLAMTHDYDWHGGKWGTHPDSTLAAATTVSLPALVTNVLNKVLLQYYGRMGMYRWYEKISTAMPHDGSTHDVTMVTLSGMTDLPVVGEGQAYPEKTISDQEVKAAFNKYGAYIGITLEMIRKNDVAKMQMLPRAMMTSAIRTRSAVVASIFTMISGTGPVMSYDTTALFEASSHLNLATTAFAYAEWGVIRTKMFKQTELGSAKRLGFLPKFAIVPVDLYDTALNVFGYGNGPGGQPGVATNDGNLYAVGRDGDPRPEIIVVPEWTDTNNWAAIVDPREVPVIQIAYANQPPGGKHPTPEIFTVDGPTEGLMFSNDTMPIKIRDWWSVGVSTHIGIHKSNVA
jgi:hypothetical protein